MINKHYEWLNDNQNKVVKNETHSRSRKLKKLTSEITKAWNGKKQQHNYQSVLYRWVSE